MMPYWVSNYEKKDFFSFIKNKFISTVKKINRKISENSNFEFKA